MKITKLLTVAPTLLAFLFVGCEQADQTATAPPAAAPGALGVKPSVVQFPVQQAAMHVNGEAIDQAILTAYATQKGLDTNDPAQRKLAREKVAEFVAVAQAAQSAGYTGSANFALDQLKFVAGGYLQSINANPPADAEVRSFYEQTVAAEGNKQYLVSHIMLIDLPRAKEIGSQLAAGKDFDQLASTLKGTPGVTRAGSLGWISPASLPEPLRPSLQALQVGQTSPMISIEGAWHFLKIVQQRERAIPAFEDVKDAVRQQMLQKRAQETLSRIRDSAKIED
jgi:peptidyl-prolyl cis-trans isomerase C